MELYQKMIEIYREKIKFRKLVHKKEIQRVEVGLNEKKNLHIHFYFSIGNE